MFKGVFFAFIFLLGACAGSFLNCLIYRIQEGKGFFSGRSYCPKCKHVLGFKDLVPIFSFFVLKGRCRYCQEKISWQYPLVELATAILFVLTVSSFQLTPYNSENLFLLFYLFLIVCCLLIIFVYDLKHFIIPDKIIYPVIGIAFLYKFFGVLDLGTISNFQFPISNFWPFFNSAASAILASSFFLPIFLISKGRWLGFGDVKMSFFMGAFLGFPNILVALFSAFFIGAIIGIGLILLGKKTLKSKIPFGPFLVIGTFLSMFWGTRIIDWYLGLTNLSILQ